MRIVMDTNVLVSGLLTPFGVCGTILGALTSNSFTLLVDSRILFEYEDVLRRPHFKFSHKTIDVVIKYIENASEIHNALPLRESLPDSDDNQFLEIAISAGADCLVTGNLKHFPLNLRCGVNVLSPREFLAILKKN